jgi:hypothetical protein
MEKLADLPTNNDGQVKPEDEELMEKMFAPVKKALTWMQIFKITVLALLLFLLLANPWVSRATTYLPYINEDSVLAPMVVQSICFVFLFVLGQKFLV